MLYVGVDLHKHSISLCVVELVGRERKVIERKRFRCDDEEAILAYFAGLGEYEAVVEATSSYEWFVRLIEPTAARLVLAHPGKLRVIAESKKKTDRLDAQTLAEFLAFDEVPQAWRPTPRVREHRTLVRLRAYCQSRITSAKNKMRWILANYNADRSDLFSRTGRAYLAKIDLSGADRLAVDLMCEELDQHAARLKTIDRRLKDFAQEAPLSEREARAVLDSIPCVGPVTTEVVLAEAGDIRRFRSQRKATAYAGLAPGIRQSDKRTKQLPITKAGSRLLRTALVELAWRLTNKTRRWGLLYERLKKRCGAKKAIVAVARRAWCVIVSLLRSGQAYRPTG
jgi:transposase